MLKGTWGRFGTAGLTHRIVVDVPLFVHHGGEPDHGDDGVEHEGEEEVFVERYPLTAQTPEGGETTGHEAGRQNGKHAN